MFTHADSNIRIGQVAERHFVLSVKVLDESAPEPVQLHHGHNVICAVIISLNVGSLGSFYWFEDPWVHPQLTIADDLQDTNARGGALVVESDTGYEQTQPLPELAVYNSALVFGIVAKEATKVLTGEYCRGLLLLRMNFYDLNFRREAFLCFYRALENFVATRILRVKRLTNELRQLQKGLAQLTDAADLIAELKEVYAIRSSQVAHSQIEQRELTVDEVLKTKVFLDFVMHKTFKQQANEAIAQSVAARGAGEG